MRLKIAICDDEQEQIEQLRTLIMQWCAQCGHTADVYPFSSAEAFLFAYEDDRVYDILLLDVEMKALSGIDLAKRIRKEGSHAEIIFVTSHFEFIGEGYEVDALHYLVKPVHAEKLSQVLTRAVEKLSVEPPSVVISCDGETVKLYESEILFVESFLHYIVIHTCRGEYRIKESISAFEMRLSDVFYRIHRSYLVSLKNISRISRTSVHIGKTELPLSRGKYDDVNRAFIEHN
ncbi:MAG: response regulator transcription factor [Clostridia bacterium]|nr:response regulator transcription factor [Clostridia bacterium]